MTAPNDTRPPDGQATAPVPCLVCGKPLAPIWPDDLQPIGAITFRGSGCWGSEFDEMSGELQINVCDVCVFKHAGRVLHVSTTTTVTQDIRPWNPEEIDSD